MSHKQRANDCIGCTVKQCEYHSGSVDNCSLDQIMVGYHAGDSCNTERCTDCKSFKARSDF